jgi:hypothetical protein
MCVSRNAASLALAAATRLRKSRSTKARKLLASSDCKSLLNVPGTPTRMSGKMRSLSAKLSFLEPKWSGSAAEMSKKGEAAL